MHLKIVIATRAPFMGGAEKAAERLALGLQQAGHEAIIVAPVENDVVRRYREVGLRCELLDLPLRDKWKLLSYYRAWRTLRRFLRNESPDVVHSNDLPTHQIVSSAAHGLPMPRICHHRFLYEGPVIDWLLGKGAEHHLFVSHGLMGPMCEGSPTLQRASRSVLYDGLELSPAPTPDDRLRARKTLGLPLDKVIVLYAGQIIERKGVADLLHAWAQLPDRARSSAALYLIGDDSQGKGAYRIQMEALAGQLGVEARFMGFQKDVAPWLVAANIAPVPSHVEPLGNATLEAMAQSLPVIGGNVGGIPEMVVDGTTGILVPPHEPIALANALARLIDLPDVRQAMGEAGRRRCEEKFSLPVHIDAVLKEYQEVRARFKA